MATIIDFTCPICHDIAEIKPCILICCNKIFHYDCIQEWLKHKNICPCCNAINIDLNINMDGTGFVKRMIKSFDDFNCTLNNLCTWHGSFEEFEKHKKVCEYKTYVCTDCNKRIFITENHKGICEYRKIKCGLCSKDIYYKNREDHKNICEENIISCRCGIKYKYRHKDIHKKICEEENIWV